MVCDLLHTLNIQFHYTFTVENTFSVVVILVVNETKMLKVFKNRTFI